MASLMTAEGSRFRVVAVTGDSDMILYLFLGGSATFLFLKYAYWYNNCQWYRNQTVTEAKNMQ